MINDEIEIAELSSNEWQEYKKIRIEMLENEPQAFNTKLDEVLGYQEEYWENKLCDKNNIHVSAKKNGEIVGVMDAVFKEEGEKEGIAVIHGAYVKDSCRGMGIGKKLLRKIIEIIGENEKIDRLKLWVKKTQIPAIKLYESEGFKVENMAGENTIVMGRNIIREL